MACEYIIEDLESKITAEIILYNDGALEISLSDKYHGITYYCNVNDFENALKKARVKLDV